MSEQTPIARHLWSAGRFFKTNHDHVAGTPYETYTKWGDKVTEVKGTIGDVALMFGEFLQPAKKFENKGATVDKPTGKAETKPTANKIAQAITATEQVQTMPATTGLDMLSFDEIRQRYATEITDDEYCIWATYQRGRLFNHMVIQQETNGWRKYNRLIGHDEYLKFHDKALVAYDGKDWVPASIYYAGAIYERINEAKTRSESIIEHIGKTRYEAQLQKLEASRPRMLRLADPESERLRIKLKDPIFNGFTITALADQTIFDTEKTIEDALIDWMRSLPKADFKHGSSVSDIVTYLIYERNFPKDTTEQKKAEVKRKGQQDLNNLFSRFLAEMLTTDDQTRLEAIWNREFNGWVEYDFSRIPIGFEINRWFKSGPIDPRKALWDGVRFMSANGSGVIAFDVGVGKTMTAILAVAQAMYTGQCKRPLIVVPNPTYAKWISETVGEFNPDGSTRVHGVLPQFANRVNDYYNLGVNYAQRAIDNPPRDYTITFMSYEGLENLGMSKGLQEQLGQELYEILAQGIDKRDQEKLREKIDGMFGDATAGTSINFDDLGFDYLVFDEAHNAKKIFTKVAGEVDKDDKSEKANNRGKSQYAITSGNPSKRAEKTFFLSQYIMRNNKMRNICLLTATPFTNSPLEIYSMLALVAYQALQKRGLNNIKDFFDKFVLETTDMVYTTRGTLEPKPVIKNFENRQVLQNIIFSYMLHRTGEEANVPRPKKVVYPRIKDADGVTLPKEMQVDTALPATTEQAYWMRQIALMANGQDNEIESEMGPHYFDPDTGALMGRDLLAVSLGRQVTLSPLLLRVNKIKAEKESDRNYHYLAGKPTPTAQEFVASSPKLQYTIGAIKTIKQWHDSRNKPMSGIVIYMNIGNDHFSKLADYIATEVGIPAKEVEVIDGSISKDKKESIKARFLDGKVKIIIGSATIKEGIDLQNKSTTLFNLTLDWNPTDIQQLEGRIWRQGNQHSHVRIVTPMIENSVDVFMFQKLEEKTSRINTIWYKAGRTNVLDIDTFDPRDLKLGLMTDPRERARVEIAEALSGVDMKINIITDDVKQLQESKKTIQELNEAEKQAKEYFAEAKIYLESELQQAQIRLAANDYPKDSEYVYGERHSKKKDETKVNSLTELLSRTNEQPAQFAAIKRHAKEKLTNGYGSWSWNQRITFVETVVKEQKQLDRLQKNVLNQHGLTYLDDLNPLIEQLEKDRAALVLELERLKSDKHFEDLTEQHRVARELADKESKSVEHRVQQFTLHNHLLSCLKDLHDCSIDEGAIRTQKAKKVIDVTPKPVKTEKDYWIIAWMRKSNNNAEKPTNYSLMLGPIATKEEAESKVDEVMKYANKHDNSGRAPFMTYSVMSTTKGANSDRKGILNDKLLAQPAASDAASRLEALKVAYDVTKNSDILARIEALEIVLEIAA